MSYQAQRRFRGTTSFRTGPSGIKAPSSSYSGATGPTAWVDPGPRPTVAADRRLRNMGILSGTVFGDDDEVQMPPLDVQDPDRDTKIKAGCTPLEMVASVGTTPYNTCQQKVAGYTSSPGGSLLDFITGGAVTKAQQQAAAANKGPSTASVVSSIFGALTAPKMPGPYPYGAPRPGMSSTTKIALLGGGALLLVALLR